MKLKKKVILAIDFDGTIAVADYPGIGAPKKNVSKVLNRLHEEGFVIIIWTCREGDHLNQIGDWMIEHDIPWYDMNHHHEDVKNHFVNDTRKVAADIYIDDKQLGGIPDDWEDIYILIHKHVEQIGDELFLHKIYNKKW